MKTRRCFIKNALAIGGATVLSPIASKAATSETSKSSELEYYEWRYYTIAQDKVGEMDEFFENVLIPAYNRLDVKVGAFKMYKPKDEGRRMLLMIYKDLKAYQSAKREIWKDKTFAKAAKIHFDTSATNRYIENIETFFCEAFSGFSKHRMPDAGRTLLEARIYWSPNEEANQRKINMFNTEEIALFDKIGINSVFYGEVLAGPRMPALMYLTWYKDEDTRNAAWKAFGTHPDWLEMKVRPQYANTAVDNIVELITPLPFSQI